MENRNADLECLLLDKIQPPEVERGFLKYVLFMEFAGVLAFMGLSSVLEILLLENLQFSENAATEIVHTFLMGEFLASFVGSILCDGFMGKYKAILIYSSLEFTGDALLLFLGCIPKAKLQSSTIYQALLLVALLMISLGHGSSVPCLGAFGGDEMKQSEVEGGSMKPTGCITRTQQFFSAYVIYGRIALVLASAFFPVIRDQSNGSYFFVFLVILFAKASGILVFWLGRKEYRSVLTVPIAPLFNGGQEVLPDTRTSSIQLEAKHWLFSKRISREDWTLITPTIIVLLPTTLFYALDFQVISTWVYQARQMDRNVSWLSHWTIPPDATATLKFSSTLISVPLLDVVIYPFVDKHIAKVTNLRKCVVGILLSTISFTLAGGIQLLIDMQLNERGGNQSDVSVFWQCPQLLASALGDVMMTLGTIDWIYTETPESVKAFGLGLSMAMGGLGNLITSVSVAFLGEYAAKSRGSFFFVGLGSLGTITLAILAHSYIPRALRNRNQPPAN